MKRYWINMQEDAAFSAYKMLDWWPVLDFLCTYSHLLTNFIFIAIALWWKITIYSFVLVSSTCLFYVLLAYRANKRAMDTYFESGLLTQCDLKMAGLITKKFMSRTSREFINLRSRFWKFQTTLFAILASLGFTSTILYRYRDFLNNRVIVLSKSIPEQAATRADYMQQIE